MDDPTEEELLALLQEPTAATVRRKQIARDMAMQKIGRALAPLINARLAHLAETLTKDKDANLGA